jgi:hypothetical protein
MSLCLIGSADKRKKHVSYFASAVTSDDGLQQILVLVLPIVAKWIEKLEVFAPSRRLDNRCEKLCRYIHTEKKRNKKCKSDISTLHVWNVTNNRAS